MVHVFKLKKEMKRKKKFKLKTILIEMNHAVNKQYCEWLNDELTYNYNVLDSENWVKKFF